MSPAFEHEVRRDRNDLALRPPWNVGNVATVPLWLLAWSIAAFALAWRRVPYDDECFSIEIALDRTPEQFWYAVNREPHPLWIAWLDRTVGSLVHAPLALQALRIVVATLALGVLAAALHRRLRLPSWAFGIAALHPIVLFYAGAARWYPYLLLAQALRLYAIWNDRPADKRAHFILGAWLGSSAGYIDGLFLAHDCVYFALRARRNGDGWRTVGSISLAACASVPILMFVSPLRGHGLSAFESIRYAHWDLGATARWIVLGLAGEGALPWPAPLLGLACIATAGWAIATALRSPRDRELATYVVSYGCTWIVAYGFGVIHPRYSLLLWILVMVVVISQLREAGRMLRVVAALGGVHLAIATALAFAGTGFYKGDLNDPTAEDCAQLRAAESGRALIVPYARLAGFARRCAPRARVVGIPSLLATASAEEQLSGLESVFVQPGRYGLATFNTLSTLTLTQSRVRAWMSARCSQVDERVFGELPHAQIRRDRAPDYRRFKLTMFECP